MFLQGSYFSSEGALGLPMQNPGENTVYYDVPDDISQKVMYLDQFYFSIIIIASASFYYKISSGFNWKVSGTSQPIMSMV